METQYTLQDEHDQTIRLLKADKHIDALFVADDNRALAVYEAIHELGLKIPEDIADMGPDAMETFTPPDIGADINLLTAFADNAKTTYTDIANDCICLDSMIIGCRTQVPI